MTQRTIKALKKMIDEMQFLVEHPRMQQKRWVAKGKTWLTTLDNAVEDLEKCLEPHDFAVEAYQYLLSVLESLGLTLQKRDATSWGYSWHGEPVKGAFTSVNEAVEAALRGRIE